MTNILDKLRGGDLRSIGKANEVVTEIVKDISLFDTVFNGLYDNDPIVKMRSADVVEKVTRNKPDLLLPHKEKIISLLKGAKQQEVCWHIAQIVPRLQCTHSEEKEIVEALKAYLSHKSKIVKVSAMESLADIAERNSTILAEVVKIINKQKETGSPALQSRGRKLLKRLERKYTDA